MGDAKKTHVRYLILLMLFLVTTINYADRATISIAGSSMQKDLGIDAVTLGYIFSAFGWAYVIGQIPGGWLLDRFGSKRVYAAGIFIWSLFTLLQGFVGMMPVAWAVVTLFVLRFMVGFAEAPSFPGNARIVAAWFPTAERGTASAIFNSAQYFATALFAPLMGWIVYSFGWEHVFVVMGVLGIVFAGIWMKTIYNPKEHPRVSAAEIEHIANNGGLVDMDQANKGKGGPKWNYIAQLLTNRMMVGVYLGQYCINAITYFFLTWFPVYLVQERGMTILKAGFIASLPAIMGFVGGVLGGVISDWLLRRGHSLTLARKLPIVCGLMLSTSMVLCNYVSAEWMVVGFMTLAFFGKGLGALGWAVVSDTSPKQIAGLSGGLFNTFGNIASITTPIVIGYIISATGSFKWALVYVGANALVAVFSYLFIVGRIQRVVLKDEHGQAINDQASPASAS
ncbi:MFS transporter [Pseudomonas argentinensis]|uniref:MFS transporter, ACS family, glucarate transporter n=1 Tax=Phytopseudomonas argentinensis TaxID=289370 RepID=A0A1I3JIQ2_9GAMM|nr:MFS transporter [Pseudomonas argentinensis]KAB0551195.1 MFS transporter [Pseudomonas argentinensis]SFI59868.1 MFS transporter, ACS family, glucarate transporter [Pseudomonas argentinensis]